MVPRSPVPPALAPVDDDPLSHPGPWSSAQVAVTGGAGFIGSHLTRRLARSAIRTTVLDLQEPAEPVPGVRYLRADLRDADAATAALAGADIVFHLAGTLDAPGSVLDPASDFEANAVTTLNVLRAARTAGARTLVFLSSALVYGLPARCPISEDTPADPVFPYAMSKHACERLVTAFGAAHGIACGIGRAFTTYGPGEPLQARAEVSQYLRALHAGTGPRILGDPDRKTRDFVHVRDVVQALILLAASRRSAIVNIGTGRETSLRQLVGLAAATLGQPAPEVSWTPSPEDECRLVPDITRLERLGFRPSVALEDGVADLAAYIRRSGTPAAGKAGQEVG